MQADPAYMNPAQAELAPSGSTIAFDNPVLVMPATKGSREYQYNLPHFIVRASVNGARCVTYDLIYDPAHHQLRISSIGMMLQSDPHYNMPFPWSGIPASVAISRVHAARGIAIASGSSPELVYFAPNPNVASAGNAAKWAGGGTNAEAPVWRLRGSDGHLYFIGIDGNVYTPSQLPIEPGASVVQP